MNELTSLVSLILLLALIVLMFLYAQARARAGGYRRGKKKFAILNEHLEKMRDTMLSESDRWPMYARPVLFTEIDREAQIEFARAQQALAEAEQGTAMAARPLMEARLADTALGAVLGLAGAACLHSPGFRAAAGAILRKLLPDGLPGARG